MSKISYINIKTFVIIFCAALIFSVSEYVYRVILSIPHPKSLIELYLINLFFISIFIFSKYKLTKIFIWLFFTLSIIANNIHYEVYSSWITSINYLLSITEFTEVTHAGESMINKLIIPFVWGILESFIFGLLFFIKPKRNYRLCDFIFIAIILFICARSFHTTQQHGISPNPNYSRLKANYFTFGHFVGKILPYYIFNLSDTPYYIKSQPQILSKPAIKNIIFIVGESQNIQHMGVFGYSRNTTPFMSSLINNPNVIIKPAYSAGLLTAIALPTLFNAIEKPNGLMQITKGDTNLFQLAKKQNFHTQFYTAQAEGEMMIMNIIGSRWIDNLVFPTSLGYEKNESMPDFNLMPYLNETNLDVKENNFLILHQRGSHMPYSALLNSEDKVFGMDTVEDKYDNTVIKTDSFVKYVYEYLNKRDKNDWILIYTSDHGQNINNKISNQGTFVTASYTVPVFIFTPNKELQNNINNHLKNCEYLFHQQISTLIIALMGYDLPISNCDVGYVNGNTLSGDIGFLQINQKTQEFKMIKTTK